MAATVEDKPSNWSRRRASMPVAKPPTVFAATSARVTRQTLELASSQLLNGLHDDTMSETAYDTAIVSHLRSWQDASRLAFPASIGWLRRHQRADGSWDGRIETTHDRIVSTRAAVVRLVELPDRWA